MFVPIVDGGVRAKGIRVNVREDDFFLTMTPFLSYIGVIYLKYLYQFLFVSALKAFSLFLPPVRSFPPEKLRESKSIFWGNYHKVLTPYCKNRFLASTEKIVFIYYFSIRKSIDSEWSNLTLINALQNMYNFYLPKILFGYIFAPPPVSARARAKQKI